MYYFCLLCAPVCKRCLVPRLTGCVTCRLLRGCRLLRCLLLVLFASGPGVRAAVDGSFVSPSFAVKPFVPLFIASVADDVQCKWLCTLFVFSVRYSGLDERGWRSVRAMCCCSPRLFLLIPRTACQLDCRSPNCVSAGRRLVAISLRDAGTVCSWGL